MCRTIASIDGAGWDQPTHLDGFTVAGLVGHVLSGIDQFSTIATGGGFNPEMTIAVGPGEATTRFDEIASESLECWGLPGALGASYPMPWGEEQGERLAAYLIIETIGHAWDLATALGHDLAVDDELAAAVLDVARSFDPATLRAPGMFGPERPAPDRATPLVELVSFLGRVS